MGPAEEATDVGFDLPDTPSGATNISNYPVELCLTIGLGLVCLFFLGMAVAGWRRTGSLLGIALLIGGVAAELVDTPIQLSGLEWFPHEGLAYYYEGVQHVPVWNVFAYAAYFGGGTYLLAERARQGLTKRTLWTLLGALWISEIIFEVAVINLGGYSYFGEQPITLFGMPYFWLVTNFPGMLIAVAILVRMPQLFTGWKVIMAVFLPGTTFALGSFGAGWPVFAAIHIFGPVGVNVAQVITILIGLWMISVTLPLIAANGPLGKPAAGPSRLESHIPSENYERRA
jgi:hypothetical protein